MPKRKLARLPGSLAEDVPGNDGLGKRRASRRGGFVSQQQSQVIEHHGPGSVRTVEAKAEAQLRQALLLSHSHWGFRDLGVGSVSSETPFNGTPLTRQ